MAKVALITGGTSGIGLAVAEDLSKTGKWQVNILGSDEDRGRKAAVSLPNTTFHQADVRNYERLASAFGNIFHGNRRIDFVFVNAGKVEDNDFYATQPETAIPPKPNFGCIDTNLDGAVYTTYLAMHYFRRSPESTKGDRHLIITSSIGGLYPCEVTPVYASTKHALVGFTRSIGKRLWAEGIRVNTVCPGAVATPLLAASQELSSFFPKEVYIPLRFVTGIISRLLSGAEMVDAKGMRVNGNEMYSRALHISVGDFFFIEKPEIHDREAQMTWNVMMRLDR